MNQTTTSPIIPRWIEVVFLVLAIPAVIQLFLPYDWDVSPFNVMVEVLKDPSNMHSHDPQSWLIIAVAIPFFLCSVSIGWGFLTLVAPNRMQGWAPKIGFGTATLGVVPFTVAYIQRVIRDTTAMRSLKDNLQLAAFGVCVIAVGFLLLINRRKWVPNNLNARIAVLAAYIPNAIFCLLVFHQTTQQAGYYVSIYVIALFAVECAVLTALGWKHAKVLQEASEQK